jgi:hypothetical protein
MKQDIHNSHTTKISIKVIELQQTQRCSKKIFMTLYKYVCMKHIYLPRYKYYECDETIKAKIHIVQSRYQDKAFTFYAQQYIIIINKHIQTWI